MKTLDPFPGRANLAGPWRLSGHAPAAHRFNDCPDLPPGFRIVTEEQLTMLIRDAVRCEMLRQREIVKTNIVSEIGGAIDEQIRNDVRRTVGALVDEQITQITQTIQRDVREEIHAQKSGIVHGPHIQTNHVICDHNVVGFFIHGALGTFQKTVGGALTINIGGVKTERIAGHFLHKAPLAKDFKVNWTLKISETEIIGPKIRFECAEHKRRFAELAQELTELNEKIGDLDITTDAGKTEASKLEKKCAKIRQEIDSLGEEAENWEGRVAQFKVGLDNELKGS